MTRSPATRTVATRSRSTHRLSTRIVVVDAGPLFALVNRSDSWHARVREWWITTTATEILVCSTVIPEVCYLLHQRVSPLAEIDFVGLIASGELTVEPVRDADSARALQLMKRYATLPVGYVDATVVAVAERLRADAILTTDRRHFTVMRDAKGRALTLVP